MYRIRILASFLLMLLPAEAGAQQIQGSYSARVGDFQTAFTRIVGECDGKVCIMLPGHGMEYGNGLSAAFALRFGVVEKKLIVINIRCPGDCAVFAAQAHEFVCIGPLVEMVFHRKGEDAKDPPMTEDINRWVRSKTGITDEASIKAGKTYPPAFTVEKSLLMHYVDALQFWQPCSPAQAASAN